MSRKPHRPFKPVASANPIDDQEREVLAHMEKGRYREAVAGYKILLKTEKRPEWMEGLSNAYAGRAKGLADKGMLQEAIGLWRSRAELCGAPLWDGPYAGWLTREGKIAEVLGYLSTRRAALAAAPQGQGSDEIAELEAQLAPALLTTEKPSLEQLPPESLLVQHRPLALAALKAYADKDPVGLEAALSGISFRSPYRDLRLVLKAMVLWETDQPAALQAISRLPGNGPFEPLAAPLRALLLSGSEQLRAWAALNTSQQALALDLKGCPPALAPFMRIVAGADKSLEPAALFNLVQRNARDLPEPFATQAWEWLAPWATRQGCESPRIFGHPSPAAQERTTALAVEIKGEMSHAEDHWRDAANLIATRGAPHDLLRAALILRHLALSNRHLSREGVLDKTAQTMLTKSLAYDKDDCDVYVRLVQYWRLHDDLKRSRELLEDGLARFPENVALLTEAVATAAATGAFKKAATTARRLLELDPLNPKVRSLVGNAHLSHAIKQITAKKPDAAKKEIKEAATWLTATADQGRMHLLLAWSEKEGSPQRLRLAQLAAATWGLGLAAGWRLVREAQGAFTRVGMESAKKLLNEAGLDAGNGLTASDVLAWVQVLEQEAPVIHKGADPLLPWRAALTKLASTDLFDSAATLRICEALKRHQEYKLLEAFANTARKRWPDMPVFVYHAVAARFEKDQNIDSVGDFSALQNARSVARTTKDFQLALRIDKLLDAADDDDDDDDYDDDYDGDEDDEDDDDDFTVFPSPGRSRSKSGIDPNEIRKTLQQTVMYDGGKSFLIVAGKILGKAQVQRLEKESTGDPKALMNRVIDLVVAKMVADMEKELPF